MDIQDLEPKIRAILTAPGTDLSTISAKRVRKQLLEDGTAPSAFIRERKHEVDEFIGDVFRRVSEEVGEAGGGDEDEVDDDVGDKRKRDEEYEEGGLDGQEEEEEVERPKKKTKASKAEIDDEEYARQLSNELNGRGRASRSGASSGSTRGRGRGRGGANGAKRGRKVKSAETVNSGDEGENGEPKKKRGGGFKKEYLLSGPLQAVLQVDKMARPQVVKQLWVYIKANDMQNPANKKEIVCDEKFRAMFNVDKIDMFKMNKVLSEHLHEPEP
ncbi:SWIB-domain-containing protein [Stereum hirsutum FP-91666 SS1]|uniref:SWIB-domain-containing protein n=1 Tax=Stereum hirsutum (strain FP-91666) TaxID=721885 RepID=UPI0004449D7C|nr:SWIB-domain-containing protein [Stereum hirsutum FP-91666 SS1]EIM85051.1 SWIB-domain-containing protein [Stereum hirsutum FP-91666 SS1]